MHKLKKLSGMFKDRAIYAFRKAKWPETKAFFAGMLQAFALMEGIISTAIKDPKDIKMPEDWDLIVNEDLDLPQSWKDGEK